MNTLTPLQLAYLAGIMDGEGEFAIHKWTRNDGKKRKQYVGLKSSVRISQARKQLLDSIAKDCGKEHVHIGRTGRGGAYFVLRFHHDYLKWLIPQLIPLLRLKQEQASIVLEFLNMPKSVGRTGVGAKEWQRRLRLRYRCCRLNATPQALEKHRQNGTLPHYRRKAVKSPCISQSQDLPLSQHAAMSQETEAPRQNLQF